MGEWYLNGDLRDEIGIDSRGLQYGDGVFETIAIRRGKPRLWSLHMDRLAYACDHLGLNMPDTGEVLALIEGRAEPYGTAKVIVAAQGGQRGYGRATRNTDVLVRVFKAQPLPVDSYRDGVDIMYCDTRLATGSAVAGLKTLNRIEQVIARSEVDHAGHFEGLTRDAGGRLICGTMSNLFAVKDDTIITPDLSRCGVEGVMRRHIIETLSATPMAVQIADIETVDDMHEVFLSNSQFGVLPVRRCGNYEWPVGERTRKVAELLAEHGVMEWAE